MQPDFLSDTELYFSTHIEKEQLIIDGEEFHHIKDVMRHDINNEIHVTDGKGNIYNAQIIELQKKQLRAKVLETLQYENSLRHVTFCIPRLKNADRFEFALEKCVELGITNFIVFDSDRSVAKGEKLERWQKILLSAMKQSLRAWLPKVTYCKSVSDLMKLDGKKIIFDQSAEKRFQDFLNEELSTLRSTFYTLVFGPEGGFTSEEYRVMSEELKVKLTGNRLRSETAVIVAASELALSLLD